MIKEQEKLRKIMLDANIFALNAVIETCKNRQRPFVRQHTRLRGLSVAMIRAAIDAGKYMQAEYDFKTLTRLSKLSR